MKNRKIQMELAFRKNAQEDKELFKKEIEQMKRKKEESLHENKKKGISKKVQNASFPPSSTSLIGTCIQIKGLGNISQKQIYKKLRKYGRVLKISKMENDDSHLAFYSNPKESLRAIFKLNQHVFKGKKLIVTAPSEESLPNIKDGKTESKEKNQKDQNGKNRKTKQKGENHGKFIQDHGLVIKNLPFQFTESDLRECFEKYGPIQKINLSFFPSNIETKDENGENDGKEDKIAKLVTRNRGFAFVTFLNHNDAEAAMNALNGKSILKRKLNISWIKDKETLDQTSKTLKNDKIMDEKIPSPPPSLKNHEEWKKEKKLSKEKKLKKLKEKELIPLDPEYDSTIFIRNLSTETNENELYEIFSEKFGPIVHCKICKREDETSRGMAFIRFRRRESAIKACKFSFPLLREAEILSSSLNKTTTTTSSSSDIYSREDSESKALEELRIKKKLPASSLDLLFIGEEMEDETERKMMKMEEGKSDDNDRNGGKGGKFITIHGRSLVILPAVNREKLEEIKISNRTEIKDKRHVLLINEAFIKPRTREAAAIWPVKFIKHREQELLAHTRLLKKDGNLFISTVRLAIKNLPPTIMDSELKIFIRKVMIACKSIAERVLGIEDAKIAKEKLIKIRQCKVVKSSVKSSSKDNEFYSSFADRGGKSKGYAFVEFIHHSHALLFQRYLTNWHPEEWKNYFKAIFQKRDRISMGNKKRKIQMESANNFTISPVPTIEFATEKTRIVNLRMERVKGIPKAKEKTQVKKKIIKHNKTSKRWIKK